MGWAMPARRARAMASRIGSLRARLVAIVVVADLVTALAIGGVIVWKARSATRLEIASAMELAQTLVADTIRLMEDAPAPVLLRSIDLHFQSVRHVKISVVDTDGRPVEAVSNGGARGDTGITPPWWFLSLAAPPIETKEFPILVNNHRIGTVTLVSEPADEIGEAWIYAHALLVTAVVLNGLVLAAMILVFGRVLAPLEALADGLRGFERKNYAVRLPSTRISELATITSHFNRTAAALAAAEEGNRRLNRQLMTAQDDERRRTALELHDEVGPCLFALEANATSILTMTRPGDASPNLARIHSRAADVVRLVERVQHINRRVLDRLRPLALGHVPLRESLLNLLVELEGEGAPALVEDVGPLRDSYGQVVDLTIYRCVQEGLLNAIRHAAARRVRLGVVEVGLAEVGVGGLARIAIAIEDDGTGLPAHARAGRGIRGMRERVEALGGDFEIASATAGTRLVLSIPIERPLGDAADLPTGPV